VKVLGFNAYGHDSAATLLIDDAVVFACEEERLNRKKHFGGVPFSSIEAALDFAKVGIEDIDHIAFFWKPSISYAKIPVYLMKFWNKVPNLLREQRNFSVEENLGMLNYLGHMRKLPQTIREHFPNKKTHFKFHLLEHHLCHAASAFYPSKFDEAAIFTIDGAGEWTTSLQAYGRANKIFKLSSVDTPYSLGAFYQAISRYLGFKLIEGPGKLMGLASYGKRDTNTYRKMKRIVKLTDSGGFELDMDYFAYHYTRKSGVSQRFIDEFGPTKTEGKNWSEKELEVASAAQQIVEDVILHMVRQLRKTTRMKNLCIAGGVGLNSVANGLIAKDGIFDNIFIQPAAGDSGTSMGAALLLNHQILDRKRKFVMETAFLGPGFDDIAYEEALRKFDLPYIKTTKNYANFAAKKLAEGKIIGWFQGRMEFGPRALGNRSIIGSPLVSNMKEVLNSRVKFREGFRPFAAIVLEEDCSEYFDCDVPNPYMLLVYNIREKYLGKLPAITHVDNSVRIQTVNKSENPQMRDLLEAFKSETGYSVLVNTSFNIKGEPIVCNPYDAVYSFDRADIDYLIMGNYVVAKKGDEVSLLNL
jgi:carbamoyltransferase